MKPLIAKFAWMNMIDFRHISDMSKNEVKNVSLLNENSALRVKAKDMEDLTDLLNEEKLEIEEKLSKMACEIALITSKNIAL